MKNEKLTRFTYGFFCAIFLLIILVQPLAILYKEKGRFFGKGYESQYEPLKKLYYSSQYVKKKNPSIIPDQALESFAGGAFLKGINPILIIHDQPPLGRYILSLSILIFDNVNTIMVLMFVLSGLGVFLVAKLVLKNTLLAFVPFGIFVNEPLFINKFSNSPLLEPIQLPFIIFALYFFILGVSHKSFLKWFILTSVMIGFIISIRFFVLGSVLVLAMFIYFVVAKQFNKRFLVFSLTLPLALIILIISYARYLFLGSSVISVFGIQKYIYNYHQTQLSLPFSFWDLLIFNRWHTWWGKKEIMSDVQWIIVWPISMVTTLIFSSLSFFRKISISESEKIIIVWVIVYSAFLSLGTVSTRYFPPLLPFIYIISTSFFIRLVQKSKGLK